MQAELLGKEMAIAMEIQGPWIRSGSNPHCTDAMPIPMLFDDIGISENISKMDKVQ